MAEKTEDGTKREYGRNGGADKSYTPLRPGRPRIKRICQQCDVIYYPSNRTNNVLYCSRACYGKWQSTNLKGKKAHGYKGARASYSAVHHWISRERGKPQHCEKCPKTTGRFEWANISGKYRRDIDDWMRLCPLCHRRYDKALRATTGETSFWLKAFKQDRKTI